MDIAFQALIEKENFGQQKIIGMGSGSTIKSFIEYISVKSLGKDKVYIPTSYETRLILIGNGYKVSDLQVHQEIDLAIDGFDAAINDQIVIKGGGGCMTWEKLVALAAKRFVLVGVEEKLYTETIRVPIEVLPMASVILMEKLRNKFSNDSVELRVADRGKLGPILTDFGNWIIDIIFERKAFIELDPIATHEWIKMQVGVVETGIFNLPQERYTI